MEAALYPAIRELDLPDGTRWRYLWLHRSLFDDAPVLDATRNRLRLELAEECRVDADTIVVLEFTPDALAESWDRAATPLTGPWPPHKSWRNIGCLFAITTTPVDPAVLAELADRDASSVRVPRRR